jgi:hypothetical protein
LNDDTVLTLLSFGVWVSLLCFSLCVAGWLGDKVRDRYNKRNYDELARVVREDREAPRGRQFTAGEVARADQDALRRQTPDKAA